MIDFELMRSAAAAVGVTLTDDHIARLDTYAALLVEWNEKMNLTAITEPHDIVVKHFADSLAALLHLPKGEFSLIDVGTGAGFPGIPLAILRPDMKLTLLDSLNKRLLFLQEVCDKVGVSAATVHARAEDAARESAYREKFDVATARAVAALPALAEYCLGYVKVGGKFLALKGPDAGDEIAAAKPAIGQLGGRLGEVCPFELPANAAGECDGRTIVCVDKIKPTPPAFPRRGTKIAKNPLK